MIYLFLLLLCGCESGKTIWQTPIGSSLFSDWFVKDENEKPKQPMEPIISYGAIKNTLPALVDDSYSYPFHKIPVGEKILDNLVPKSDINFGKPLDGKALAVYENVTSFGQLDLSELASLIPDSDGDSFEPGENIKLPFEELNKDPRDIASPFSSLNSIAKAPPLEFVFDEVLETPEFFKN